MFAGTGEPGLEDLGVISPDTDGGWDAVAEPTVSADDAAISLSTSGAKPSFFFGPGFFRILMAGAETLSMLGSRCICSACWTCFALPFPFGDLTGAEADGAGGSLPMIERSTSSATLTASFSNRLFLVGGGAAETASPVDVGASTAGFFFLVVCAPASLSE